MTETNLGAGRYKEMEPVADSGDGWGSGWEVLLTAFGMAGSALTGAWARGRVSGESDGELRAWKAATEARMAAQDAAINAIESRLGFRLTQIEARKDRIDDKLERVATREELKEGLERVESQIQRLDEYIRKMS